MATLRDINPDELVVHALPTTSKGLPDVNAAIRKLSIKELAAETGQSTEELINSVLNDESTGYMNYKGKKVPYDSYRLTKKEAKRNFDILDLKAKNDEREAKTSPQERLRIIQELLAEDSRDKSKKGSKKSKKKSKGSVNKVKFVHPGEKKSSTDIDEIEGVPKSFICPMSLEPFKEPVSCSDGHTYEKSFINEWLKKNDTSPITGLELSDTRLIPNHAIKCMISEWLELRKK